jgi:hypothetical protein
LNIFRIQPKEKEKSEDCSDDFAPSMATGRALIPASLGDPQIMVRPMTQPGGPFYWKTVKAGSFPETSCWIRPMVKVDQIREVHNKEYIA